MSLGGAVTPHSKKMVLCKYMILVVASSFLEHVLSHMEPNVILSGFHLSHMGPTGLILPSTISETSEYALDAALNLLFKAPYALCNFVQKPECFFLHFTAEKHVSLYFCFRWL